MEGESEEGGEEEEEVRRKRREGRDVFVYCTFSRPFKVDPSTWQVWMEVMKGVPSSVLMMLTWSGDEVEDRAVQSRWKAEAEMAGVNGSRLLFFPLAPFHSHLRSKSICDLYLDTLPFNGHGTIADTLFARVPVLTLPGERAHASRLGSAIALTAGCPHEAVAMDRRDYVKKGIKLGSDVSAYTRFRASFAFGRVINEEKSSISRLGNEKVWCDAFEMVARMRVELAALARPFLHFHTVAADRG
uniref:O-GlcNAc transferase C-terminal domain-containing protein n=1 Tax=Palpitomonas bilix TaxID=652834 RepID=A0A7S3D8X5_9EUKA|mmetsp:Transcript_25342/g.63573  ORF Transcript_25342/g.63573 Transcript_25342/m.63573 type:complete len:244 (+) Transcript_25342:1-732(+)